LTGAERGFLLLCCHLGDPHRRPLTVAQFRRLARLVRSGEKQTADRDLELSDLIQLGCGKAEAQRILDLLDGEELLVQYLRKARKSGCVPLTPLSPGYPRRLLTALGDDAPACLWARGDLSLLERPGVALVGSRDLNRENFSFAQSVGKFAAENGFVLISGNARGADKAGQEAALAAGGKVVSVVADRLTDKKSNPNILYLSEDSFDLPFASHRALSRNRIIHGLGAATLVAQCRCRTGGTWDGTEKNLRFGWSPVYCYADGSPAQQLLADMGAQAVTAEQLRDFSLLPKPAADLFMMEE
jgi:predicted Rossmann fold nucleotide-binding protein DprA/Smf involved in DNA uptake